MTIMPVWLGGNVLVSTSVITVRQDRLGRVNQLAYNQAPRSIQPEPSLRG